MKKLILMWLFGTDDIDSYMHLLRENIGLLNKDIEHNEECIALIDHHKKTLEREEWELEMIRKLIKICENHGINVDEEIKHIELHEVNANETLD